MPFFRKVAAVVVTVLSLLTACAQNPPPAAAPTTADPAPPPLPDDAAALLLLARDGNDGARARLLTVDPADRVAAVKAELCRPDYDHQPFYNQLLMDLVPAETRGLTRALLEQGQYNCFIPREAWQAAFTDAELKEQALTLPSGWAHAAYELVRNPDPAFVRAFISNPANQWGHVIEYDVGVARAAENYDVLTRAGKLYLVDAGARRGALGLTDLMAKETDACVVQEILYGEKQLEKLIASIDQHGACQGNAFWRDWQWEKKAAADYPDSF
ncbi:MAG TPA: hypothetical protein VNT75_30840, partial [Symbiobacteriaceae bacterium]|nr:hypothetical protein [Symbiobacteriaceae bacterium]